jgi:tetratricopeptide (TPR) repeat protein
VLAFWLWAGKQVANKNRDWFDIIRKLPGWITGLIAFVTAVVGFIKMWQGDRGLVTIVLLTIGLGSGLIGCAYVAFKRTPPLVAGGQGMWRYPRWRLWALADLVIIPLLAMSGVGYNFYQQSLPTDKIIILVADFDEPDRDKYRVTETLLTNLRQALEGYDDVEVVAMGRPITEAEGSAVARAEGEKHKATIVIWGWYGLSTEIVPRSVHFQVLRAPEFFPDLGPEVKGKVQTQPRATLEEFTFQLQLSSEIAYLSLFTAGMAHYAAEDWDVAIACFTDALSQADEPVPGLNQGVVYGYRGSAYDLRGDRDKAIADYDRSIAALDQAIKLQPDDARAYNGRGIAYGSKEDYDRAIDDFDQAIKLKPDYARAYANRGITYGSKGDYDRAIDDYNQAIELQPDDASAYTYRGIAYGSKGDFDRAIADFDQAIELQPDDAFAYTSRGYTYYQKGDYDRAIDDYNQAIKLKPDYADAYTYRGIAYGSKGDFDRAIADFDQAIELQPDDAFAYTSRGDTYYQKGDFDRAIADYNQIIELQPDDAFAYYERGIAYEAKGDFDRAIAD